MASARIVDTDDSDPPIRWTAICRVTRQPIRGAGSGATLGRGFTRLPDPAKATDETETKMPDGVEWALVTTTEDLMNESHNLAQIAWEFREHRRSWTHPAARAALQHMAEKCSDWAQEAAVESTRGDTADRLDALQLALQRRQAARLTFRHWWQRSQLWNENRMKPVPVSVWDGATQ